MKEYSKNQLNALMAEQKKEIEFYSAADNVGKNDTGKSSIGWMAVISTILAGFFGGFVNGGVGGFFAIVAISLIIYYFSLLSNADEVRRDLMSAKAKLADYEHMYHDLQK